MAGVNVNHIANEDLTLLIPVEVDEKDVVTKYRVVYLINSKMEAINSAELSDIGLDDTKGVEVYFIFKYSKALDTDNNKLTYINWKQYESLDDVNKLRHFSLNDKNCLIVRNRISIDSTDTKKSISKLYDTYTIRSIEELYKNNKIHHLEMIGV